MTPYYMRGRRKQTVGRGAGEDAQRGAIAGGGAIAGDGGEGDSTSTQPSTSVKLEETPIVPKKRKRSGSGEKDGQKAGNQVEHHNGVDVKRPDRDYPELDVTEVDKWKEVIERQFSLEILLKNQERQIIENERAKVQTAITQLEQCISAGEATYHETPNRFTNYYSQFVDYASRGPVQHNGTQLPTSTARPQRNAAMKAAARHNSSGNVCLAKNDQGKVVRVTCPDCQRYDFSNVQGFINHCRIAHKIEYASHDDAVRHCGIEIELSDLSTTAATENTSKPSRPGIQSILNTSSTLSGKHPQLNSNGGGNGGTSAGATSGGETPFQTDLTTAYNEYVASPVQTRARANSMFNGDFSQALIFNQPVIHSTRRNSTGGHVAGIGYTLAGSKNKRPNPSRGSSRRTTSTGIPSPADTDGTPSLKHLSKFARSSSLEYDIDGFVDEMRREKHNLMLMGDEGLSDYESEEEEKPTKKPHAGVRRPAAAGRTPANWISPVPGLVEVPATRLRNRQQKEKERLAKLEADSKSSDKVSIEETKMEPKAEEEMLDVVATDSSMSPPRGRTVSKGSRQSPFVVPRITLKFKKSPMEEQPFLSTLPLRMKNRRRRVSSSIKDTPTANEQNNQPTQDEGDNDSDETSFDDEPGKQRQVSGQIEGTMTPTGASSTTGFVGLSCGKDAPNVKYVSPAQEKSDILARPDLVDGSRFYIKRRIKIGNSSKFIPESKRNPKMAKYTHKWMIYIVSPPYSAPISTFLSSVTIFLDESFPLPRIIELRVPPFRWISYGWGEFNLNIRLVFCDPAKNKPIDVVHPLKLDPGKSSREVVGYEGYFDVELDRNTQFLPGEPGVEFDQVPKMADVERMESGQSTKGGGSGNRGRESRVADEEGSDKDTIRVKEIRDSITVSPERSPVTSHKRSPVLSRTGSFDNESVSERISEMDDAEVRQMVDSLEPYTAQLREAVEHFPLISETAKLPYSVAPSKRTFLSWNVGRQKSVEWHRAKCIQSDVSAQLQGEDSSDLTVKAIVLWCRQNRYGPPTASELENDEEVRYCRFCGMIAASTPPKGQRRKSTLGVDAYCRCSQNVSENLSVLKTSSSVQDMIDRSSTAADSHSDSSQVPQSLSPREIRTLLSQTDVTFIRWVWSTIQQLNLPSTKEDNVSLDVSAVMAQATRIYLLRIIRLSIQQHAEQISAPDSSAQSAVPPLVITPIHILQAIRAGRELDFLTNAGMATGSSSQQGGASVTGN